jgi:DnaJ-class molecular chaperone
MLAVARNNQKETHTMSKEINGQTRWSPEQFGAFAAGTAEGADPTKTACPVCKGTGLDWNNSNVRDCEECDGYGEVNK